MVASDRLNLPSVLVLNDCGITKAGDRTEVATFCAHVVELDLSHNQLKDWEEVCVYGRVTERWRHNSTTSGVAGVTAVLGY